MALSATCKRLFAIDNTTGGGVILFSWQKASGGYLAYAREKSSKITVYNRMGKEYAQITFEGGLNGMEWDEDGDFLAVLIDGFSTIILWDVHSKKTIEIDSGFKEGGNFLAWSRVEKTLAVTTSKGHMLIYNHREMKKIPVSGKQTRKVLCIGFSNQNVLVLATAENLMSLSNTHGDIIKSVMLRAKPSNLKFGQIKEDRVVTHFENAVSVVLGEKTLYMLKLEENASLAPLELGFQARYGAIIGHHWHGDGYILVAFSQGFVVLLSSHHKEMGTELSLCELKSEPLRHTALCSRNSKLAICVSDVNVEIREAGEPRSLLGSADISEGDDKVRPAKRSSWSHDGQLLAVLNSNGDVFVFLTAVPLLGAATPTHVAYMSSLTDLQVSGFSTVDGPKSVRTTRKEYVEMVKERSYILPVEPTLLALGKGHVAVSSINRAWFYAIHEPPGLNRDLPLTVKEYNGTVHQLAINAKAVAVRFGDRATLHWIECTHKDARDTTHFPNLQEKPYKIFAVSLSKDFFLYGGENSLLRVWHLERWKEINTIVCRQYNGVRVNIKAIYPDATGVNVIVTAKTGEGFIVDLLEETSMKIEGFPTRCDGILWDVEKKSSHVFIVYNLALYTVEVFVIWKNSYHDRDYGYVGNFKVFSSLNHLPISLKAGVIISQSTRGKTIKTASLYVERPEDETDPYESLKLKRLCMLRKFSDACEVCKRQNRIFHWKFFFEEALKSLNFHYAIKAAVMVKRPGLIWKLKKIRKTEDSRTILGLIGVLLHEYDNAERHFFKSADKIWTLHIRRNLHQWDEARRLAEKFAPDDVPEIIADHGRHFEVVVDALTALPYYEKAYESANPETKSGKRAREKAHHGLARCYISCGQVDRGMVMALHVNDDYLKRQCALLCEKVKKYEEGATLWEILKCWNRVATLRIKLKQWDKVKKLFHYVKSPRFFLQFAKAKEAEGQEKEAAKAYELANEFEASVRLFLAAGLPDEAIRVVKICQSTTAAMQVARFFEKIHDVDTALRFLVISRCKDDGMLVALRAGRADILGDIIVEYKLQEEFKETLFQIANYFEEMKDPLRAGKHYYAAKEYSRAYRMLMRAAATVLPAQEDYLFKFLIATVVDSKVESYAKELVNFLIGSKDGNLKDPRHLLNFYMAAGRLVEASKTALVLAADEREKGNYRSAHQLLFTALKEVRAKGIRAPRDLVDALFLIHAYNLVRVHMGIGNHKTAGRLLVNLSENISMFPAHEVQLLTTTVIECQKARLRKSAMNALFELMKPHRRQQINTKYKNKFELMVRKSSKANLEEEPDEHTACPHCNTLFPSYVHVCPECRSVVPFCIASGRHITIHGLTACPQCDLPAIQADFSTLLEAEAKCPMCGSVVQPTDLKPINDPQPYLFGN